MRFFNHGDLPPSMPTERRQAVRLLRMLSGAVGLGLALQFVSSLGFAIDTASLPTSGFVQASLVDAGGYVLSFLLGYAAICAMTGLSTRQALPLKRIEPDFSLAAVGCGMVFSLGGAMATTVINSALAAYTGVKPVMGDIPTPDTPMGWAVYFVTVALLPSLFEEILFRGAVLQALRPLGDGFAIVISSLMFALAHGNLVQGPNSFGMGLLLATLTLYSGSIKTAIFLHFFNNFIFAFIAVADEITGGLPERAYSLFIAGLIAWGAAGLAYLLRAYPGVFSWRRGNWPMGGVMKTFHFFTTPAMVGYLALSLWLIAMNFVPVAPQSPEGALLRLLPKI